MTTEKQSDLWEWVSDRVNLEFGNQRTAGACYRKWQFETEKQDSCGEAKMNSPDKHKKRAQLGHVNAVESSESKALTKGSGNEHKSTSEGHNSNAHEGHENDMLAVAKAEGSAGDSQQSRADLKIEVADE